MGSSGRGPRPANARHTWCWRLNHQDGRIEKWMAGSFHEWLRVVKRWSLVVNNDGWRWLIDSYNGLRSRSIAADNNRWLTISIGLCRKHWRIVRHSQNVTLFIGKYDIRLVTYFVKFYFTIANMMTLVSSLALQQPVWVLRCHNKQALLHSAQCKKQLTRILDLGSNAECGKQ